MTGFGIEETADSFILRRGDEEIRMSKEEFFSLRSQMNLWTERRLLEYSVSSDCMGGRMAGCNPRKCSIDFDLGRDTGGVCFADPDCGWSCWCLGACSVIDADRAEGLAAGALLVRPWSRSPGASTSVT